MVKTERIVFRNRYGEDIIALLDSPFEPNGKGVVLLHCFLCSKDHSVMRAIAGSLVSSGFLVLRPDFSGSGESGGHLEDAIYSKMISDAADAVSYLESIGVGSIGMAGHSMGAMISLLCASGDRRVKSVAFIAGSSEAGRVREIFPSDVIDKAELDGSAEAVVYGRVMTLTRKFLDDIKRYDVPHSAASLGKPILIVHGTADTVIPPSHAERLYAFARGQKAMRLIKDADHHFRDSLCKKELCDSICAWFNHNI